MNDAQTTSLIWAVVLIALGAVAVSWGSIRGEVLRVIAWIAGVILLGVGVVNLLDLLLSLN